MKDMVLSKRMETVVNMVSPRSFTVADVGCDHAYVSIALIERKIVEKVVAMDVRKGPLAIAKKNIALYGLEDKIELRLSDGLCKIVKGEVDSIIIAGMGGLLMQSILEKGTEILEWEEKRPTLILQPQSDIYEIRIFLQAHAYHIVQEKMLVEEGKYYTVIKAEPGIEKREYSRTELQYGRYTLERKDVVLYEYLKQEQKMLKGILQKLTDITDGAKGMDGVLPDKTLKRQESVRKELELNSKALEYYGLLGRQEDADEV